MIHLCLCLVVGLLSGWASSAPEIATVEGKLQGVDKAAIDTNITYYAYYAIPYAMPPTGDRRFKKPESFHNDDPSAVINGNNYGAICFQTNFPAYLPQSEDCLTLNVFVPSTSGGNKKVMVYVHGGAYTTGDATLFSPSSLVTDFDVIVVIMQYRLGPLGFLSAGDDELPGNNGLWDQLMALSWAKDNAALFGGDPDDITFFGESAGAMSVSLLSLSPLTKGLFTKAQTQSANALAPWAFDLDAVGRYERIAELTNCTKDSTALTLDCLRKVDASELSNLLNHEAALKPEDTLNMAGIMNYGPTIDGTLVEHDPYDIIGDVDYLTNAGTLDRKYMMGINNNEPLVFFFGSVFQQGVNPVTVMNPESVVAQECAHKNVYQMYGVSVSDDIAAAAGFMYFYPRNAYGLSSLQSSLDMWTDIDFAFPLVESARALYKASLAANRTPEIYIGLFDHYPQLTNPASTVGGTAHALDLSYLFDQGSSYSSWMFYCHVYTPESLPLMDIYREMVVNFAKGGNPSISIAPWPAFDLTSEGFMSISTSPKASTNLYARRLSVWDDFLPHTIGIDYLRNNGRLPPSCV